MKARLLALSILLPSTAFGASLPLINGEYTRGKCQGRPDILESMGIYTVDVGPDKGHRILVPDGEDGGDKSVRDQEDHVIGQHVLRDYEMLGRNAGGL